jgi:hypothetical protein
VLAGEVYYRSFRNGRGVGQYIGLASMALTRIAITEAAFEGLKSALQPRGSELQRDRERRDCRKWADSGRWPNGRNGAESRRPSRRTLSHAM